MKKDLLQQTLESIEKWCNTNDVALFYGSIEDNLSTEVAWNSITGNDWIRYIENLKKIEPKILIIDVTLNEIDLEPEEISAYRETLSEDELDDYNNSIEVVKKTKGQVAEFQLSFFHNNVCYSYSQEAEWIENYLEVQESLFAADDDDEDEGPDHTVDEGKQEDLARKIATSDKFLNAKNPVERRQIADSILKQQEVPPDGIASWRIKRRADSIYETEIRPKHEEEIKKKVLELKKTGMKKVAIASKLNISVGMVNKFYYKDND